MKCTKNKLILIIAVIASLCGGFWGYKKVISLPQKQKDVTAKGHATQSTAKTGRSITNAVSQGGAANTLAATPWPVFQADERHTGRSIFTGQNKLRPKWLFEVNTIVESSVVTGVDGSLYFGAYDSNFYSVTPSGKLRWKFQTRGPVRATAAIARDGTIYAASRYGALYALNLNGTARWIKVLSGQQIDSSPVIGHDGTIFVGCHDGYLYAVNPDGTLKWVSESLGHISASSPAVGEDGTIYIGSYDCNLYALDSDGGIKWKFETEGGVRTSPSIDSDGTIYAGSRGGIMYAINQDGTLKWKFEAKSDIRTTASIAKNGTVIFGSWDGNLYAVSKTGGLVWSYNTGRSIEASASIDGAGSVYFTSLSGHLYVLTPDGKLRQKLPTYTFIHGSPVISDDGTIYLTAGTRLLAFGIPSPTLEIDTDKIEFAADEAINTTVRVNNQDGEDSSLNLKIWIEFIESGQRKIISLEDRLLSITREVLNFSILLNPFIQKGDAGLYKLRARLTSLLTGEEIDYKEAFFYRYERGEK
ncbi:MAG: PQQ-like beta-propeller repeat protein [Candidatus Brocadia sp.]|jgi:outer membrane protein assembly factor BamB